MTSGRPIRQVPESDHLSAEKATVFLKLGLAGPKRLVDELIDQLRGHPEPVWIANVLGNGPMRGVGAPAAMLIEGQATLEQLTAIKERSKVLAKEPAGSEARLGGIAGYFFSIAAGLRHHGELLTTRDRHQLRDILLDLAEAAPEPYGALLGDAALHPAAR